MHGYEHNVWLDILVMIIIADVLDLWNHLDFTLIQSHQKFCADAMHN